MSEVIFADHTLRQREASRRCRNLPLPAGSFLLPPAGTFRPCDQKCPCLDRHCDRLVFIADGVIVEEGRPAQVLSQAREERTRRFLSRVLRS